MKNPLLWLWIENWPIDGFQHGPGDLDSQYVQVQHNTRWNISNNDTDVFVFGRQMKWQGDFVTSPGTLWLVVGWPIGHPISLPFQNIEEKTNKKERRARVSLRTRAKSKHDAGVAGSFFGSRRAFRTGWIGLEGREKSASGRVLGSCWFTSD